MHGGGWWAFLSYDASRDRPTVDRRLLRRVERWARPYYGQVAAMLALLLFIALIELVPPLLYGQLIDRLGDGTLARRELNLLALGLFAVPLGGSVLAVVQRWLSARIGEGLIYDLRVATYAHLHRMGLRYFTETPVGEIMSRLTSDVVGAQSAVTNTIPNLLTNLLTVVTTLAVMLRLDWRLTLVAVAALPLFLLPTRRVGRLLRDIRREAAEHDARMSRRMAETLGVSGALLVRTSGQAEAQVARFGGAAADVRDIGIRRAVVGRWFFFGLGVAAAVGTALMYWTGGLLALGAGAGAITPGLIVTFAAYVNRLYGPVSSLSNLQVEFATSLVSFERIFEVLDLPVEIDERPGAEALDTVRGHVTLEDVHFSYAALPPALRPADGAAGGAADGAPTGERADGEATDLEWAVAGLDCDIAPGRLVALVGPSGAGKTTVSYLLARLYDPTRGRITLDGVDLRDLTLTTIARHVGVVTQEAYLLHDTIIANLRFARPDADDASLEAACRAANIHARILELPDGFETVVGERGFRLSGGEKQRLALARVLLQDPSVLVLDEATSHLDSRNEALIQGALERVMEGRTSVVIAHRLSTVLAADLILVLQEGRVAERGTHAELLAHGGLYAELFKTQFAPSGPAPAA